MSNSLWPHELQHTRLPCPSLSPGICSNSCPLSWWCHPTVSSSVTPFSSCHLSLPASGSFPMGWLWDIESVYLLLRVLILNIESTYFKIFPVFAFRKQKFYVCGWLATYHFPGYFNRIQIYAFNNYLKIS